MRPRGRSITGFHQYQRLTRHDWLDASSIDVEVDNGEVTLWGQVQNRREKRMAGAAVEAVPGVIDIHNRLRNNLV